MKEIYRVIFSNPVAVCVALIFIFSSPVCGQNASTENLEQAKARLEELFKQWQWLDRDYYETLDAELLKRVDKSPKGEFETTKQFEDRTAKTEKLEEQIRAEVLKKNGAARELLDRRMNQIMTTEFDVPFTARLGTYDADAQRFPISFASGSEEFLSVPLSEAKEFKEKAAQSETIGKFSLFLDSEGRAKEYLLSGKILFNNKSYQITPKNMDIERAMFLLFGNIEPAKKRAVWRYVYGNEENKEYAETDAPEVESVMQSKFNSKSIYVFYNQKMYAMPVFSKAFQENGLSKFLFVAGSVRDEEGDDESFGEGCHGCGVNMSAATFVLKNGIWKLENFSRNLGDYGPGWGNPPDTSLVKIGKGKYAILFKGGWFGQGVETATSYYIGRVDGAMKEILSVTNAYDTSGTGYVNEDSQTIKAKVEFLPVADSDYFNIKITTTGQKGVKAGKRYLMKPFNEVILYKFAEGSYQPATLSKQNVSTKVND